MIFSKFQKPDVILRPAPFWAINEQITPEEAARQFAEMLRVGFSGGFFHSRAGLITDYLGDDWFNSIQATVDTANKEDGYLWLYDEDLWPSGNAGGRIAALGDEYRAAVLQPEYIAIGAEALPDGEDLPRAAYRLVGRKGSSAQKIEKIDFEEARTQTDCERILFRNHYAEKIPWWGGESSANLLNPNVTRQFIKQTHEVYKEKLGKEFGKRIPGIFTDEPNIMTNWCGQSAIAWWDGIPDKYLEWTQRNFWEDLPYLYLDGPDSRLIRLQIHRTIARQFCEAYSKPLFEWCDRNSLPLTGHFLEETSFAWQINATSGGIMAHYRYEHIPGMDHLCRAVSGSLQSSMAAKQVGSAARQLGRKQVLVESFGASRHTNTFEDFKWLADNDMVLGATFFCPHLSLYSIKGRRKRDYPPNWNYQQTYWDDLPSLTDYMTRMGYILSSGTAVPDLVIVHPIESATSSHRYGLSPLRKSENQGIQEIPEDLPGEDFGMVNYLNDQFRQILDGVLNAGYDCDLGDETYLEEMGSVEGDRLRIGEMTYPVVVIPPSITWRPKTFSLLKNFVSAGGRLIILGKIPTEIDCKDASKEWKDLAYSPKVTLLPAGARPIQDLLGKFPISKYSVRDPEGNPVPFLYVQHRKDGEQEFFYIVNSDQGRSHDYVFTLIDSNEIPMAIWDATDGSCRKLETTAVGNRRQYAFNLPPAGSLLIAAGTGVDQGALDSKKDVNLQSGKMISLPNVWEFKRSEENVLVLDRISVSLDDGKTWWDEDMDFRVRRKLSEHYGITESLTWQPWVAIRKGIFKDKGGPVILRYQFENSLENPKNISLVIEDIDKGHVLVNGNCVDTTSAGWHWDRKFGKIDITQWIQQGQNYIDFKIDYNFLSEIEPAYLIGDFGVILKNPIEGIITQEPKKLEDGTWVNQGYPFYSGSMTYKTVVNLQLPSSHTFLRLIHASGILYKIRINGEDAGRILWRPHLLEITPYVKSGKNEIEITVVSSRQNTFGPLHEKEMIELAAAPDHFENEGVIRPEFNLFDYGLLGGAELVSIP